MKAIYYFFVLGFLFLLFSKEAIANNKSSNRIYDLKENISLFNQDTIRVCGSSYTLDAGQGFNSYLWNTGATTSSIFITNSGWYKCVVDGSVSDSVFMLFYDASIKNNDTSICTGNSVLLQSNYSNNNIRYIKFSSTYSADNGQVNVYEIQAYRNGINLCLNKTGFFNSPVVANRWSTNGKSAIDGNNSSRWSSNRNDPGPDSLNPHYLVIDLQNKNLIDSIILNIKGFDSWAQTFKIQVASDTTNWFTIGQGTNITGIFTYRLNLNIPPSPFTWSTGQSTASISVFPTQTTTYYTSFNNGSCIKSDSVTIIVNQPTSSTTNLSLCPNQLPYQWNGLIINTAGIYNKTLVNSVGCDSLARLILMISYPNLFIEDTIRVCGNTHILDAGIGYAFYQWNTGATSQSIETRTSGWNKCAVSNDGICYGSDSVYMIFYDASIKNNDTSICIGSLVTLKSSYTNKNLRYIKFSSTYSEDDGQVNVNEIQAYRNGVNIALNKTGYDYRGYQYLNDAVDGNEFSRWSSDRDDPGPDLLNPHFIVIDLQNIYSIDSIILIIDYAQNFQLLISSDANNWITIGEVTNRGGNFNYKIDNTTPTFFYWSTGQTTTSISVSPTQTTTYYTSFNNGTCVQRDSVTIIVNQPSSSTTNLSLCPNQLPYQWNGLNIYAAGNYNKTLINAFGCDSLAILVLIIVNQSSSSTTNLSLCPNQLPYQWNGLSIYAAGIYNKTLVNSVGCDSLARLVLTITYPNLFVQDTIRICGTNHTLNAGIGFAFYQWNTGATSQSIQTTTTGWYKCTVSNDGICYGADSIFLIFYDASIKNNDTSICIGNSVLLQSNYLFSNNNIRYIKFSSTYSADNGQVNVYEIQAYRNGINIALNKSGYANSYEYGNWSSNGKSAIDGNNSSRWSSNRNDPGPDSLNPHYILIDLQNSYTIDSIRLNIKGFDSWAQTFKFQVSSDTINWFTIGQGTNITGIFTYKLTDFSWSTGQTTSSIIVSPTQTTTYYTIFNNEICIQRDSVTIHVNQPSSSTTNLSLCSNQLPYQWNGINIIAAGVYNKTLINTAGCDSLARLNLYIKSTPSSSTNLSICSNQLPYVWNGFSFNTSGTYNKILLNESGCDSIAILNLTVNSTSTSFSNVTACGSYIWNGVEYTSNGTYSNVTTNAAGCDSTAVINLTFTTTSTSPSAITGVRNINKCDTLQNYSVLPITGVTFTWSVTGTGNYLKTGQGTNAVIIVMKVAGIISVKATNSCGIVSIATTLSVTKVKPIAPGTIYQRFIPTTITANPNVCMFTLSAFATTGIADTFRIRAVANATGYLWIAPIGSIVTRLNDTTIAVVFSNSITIPDSIKVYTLSSCDTSLARVLPLKKAATSIPGLIYNNNGVLANSDVCSNIGSSVIYKIRKVSTVTYYNWYMTRGTKATITHINPLGVNDTAIIVNYQTGFTADSINVSCSNGCGTSALKLLRVSAILPPPTPSKITASTGNFYPCRTNFVQYAATSPVATTAQSPSVVYRWTRPANTTIIASNADSSVITIRFESTYSGGSLSVKCQTACGIQGSAKSQALYYTPPTPTGINSDAGYNVCIGSTVSLTCADPVSGGTGETSTQTQTPITMHHWTKPNFTSITSATVDSGTISLLILTGFNGGNVSAKCQSSCGVTGTAKSQTLSLSACPTVAKNSNAYTGVMASFEVNIFPNPTKSAFNLQVSSTSREAFSVKVMDVQGRLIKSMIVFATEINNIGNDLKSGVYMFEITQGKEKKTVRVVKY